MLDVIAVFALIIMFSLALLYVHGADLLKGTRP